MICLLRVAESTQGLDDSVLRFGLARIDDVVNFSDIAKMRMVERANGRGNPTIVSVRVFVELAISEVAAQQPEFPEVVGDILADVADGSIRTHDDFLIFLGNFLCVCCGCGFSFPHSPHYPTAFVLALSLEIEHAGIFQLDESSVPEMQMQDFTFTRQEVILDIQAVHGLEVAAQDGN